MASGFGARGSEGRCAPIWREFAEVRARRDAGTARREDDATRRALNDRRARNDDDDDDDDDARGGDAIERDGRARGRD